MTLWKRICIGLLTVFLLAVAVEQWFSYRAMRRQVGQYTYAAGYALQIPGKEGEYIGQIVDTKWNAMPEHEDDIQGFQPRFLIARETVPGVTETKWWCSYLFEVSPDQPQKFKPSPFPKYRRLTGTP